MLVQLTCFKLSSLLSVQDLSCVHRTVDSLSSKQYCGLFIRVPRFVSHENFLSLSVFCVKSSNFRYLEYIAYNKNLWLLHEVQISFQSDSFRIIMKHSDQSLSFDFVTMINKHLLSTFLNDWFLTILKNSLYSALQMISYLLSRRIQPRLSPA